MTSESNESERTPTRALESYGEGQGTRGFVVKNYGILKKSKNKILSTLGYVAKIGDGRFVEFEPFPFESGSMQFAFRGELLKSDKEDILQRTGYELVVKVPQMATGIDSASNIARYNWLKSCAQSSVDRHRKAIDLAKNFNEAKVTKKIKIKECYLAQIIKAPPLLSEVSADGLSEDENHFINLSNEINLSSLLFDGSHVTAEAFISGPFTKFLNNDGCFNKSILTNLPGAFAHWTWEKSKGNFMVCDIQGVRKATKYILTDPCVHSRRSMNGERFGPSDLGEEGMKEFFRKHECNLLCKDLNLEPIKQNVSTLDDIVHFTRKKEQPFVKNMRFEILNWKNSFNTAVQSNADSDITTPSKELPDSVSSDQVFSEGSQPLEKARSETRNENNSSDASEETIQRHVPSLEHQENKTNSEPTQESLNASSSKLEQEYNSPEAPTDSNKSLPRSLDEKDNLTSVSNEEQDAVHPKISAEIDDESNESSSSAVDSIPTQKVETVHLLSLNPKDDSPPSQEHDQPMQLVTPSSIEDENSAPLANEEMFEVSSPSLELKHETIVLNENMEANGAPSTSSTEVNTSAPVSTPEKDDSPTQEKHDQPDESTKLPSVEDATSASVTSKVQNDVPIISLEPEDNASLSRNQDESTETISTATEEPNDVSIKLLSPSGEKDDNSASVSTEELDDVCFRSTLEHEHDQSKESPAAPSVKDITSVPLPNADLDEISSPSLKREANTPPHEEYPDESDAMPSTRPAAGSPAVVVSHEVSVEVSPASPKPANNTVPEENQNGSDVLPSTFSVEGSSTVPIPYTETAEEKSVLLTVEENPSATISNTKSVEVPPSPTPEEKTGPEEGRDESDVVPLSTPVEDSPSAPAFNTESIEVPRSSPTSEEKSVPEPSSTPVQGSTNSSVPNTQSVKEIPSSHKPEGNILQEGERCESNATAPLKNAELNERPPSSPTSEAKTVQDEDQDESVGAPSTPPVEESPAELVKNTESVESPPSPTREVNTVLKERNDESEVSPSTPSAEDSPTVPEPNTESDEVPLLSPTSDKKTTQEDRNEPNVSPPTLAVEDSPAVPVQNTESVELPPTSPKPEEKTIQEENSDESEVSLSTPPVEDSPALPASNAEIHELRPTPEEKSLQEENLDESGVSTSPSVEKIPTAPASNVDSEEVASPSLKLGDKTIPELPQGASDEPLPPPTAEFNTSMPVSNEELDESHSTPPEHNNDKVPSENSRNATGFVETNNSESRNVSNEASTQKVIQESELPQPDEVLLSKLDGSTHYLETSDETKSYHLRIWGNNGYEELALVANLEKTIDLKSEIITTIATSHRFIFVASPYTSRSSQESRKMMVETLRSAGAFGEFSHIELAAFCESFPVCVEHYTAEIQNEELIINQESMEKYHHANMKTSQVVRLVTFQLEQRKKWASLTL